MPSKGGGVNDKMALTEEERSDLTSRVSALVALEAEGSAGPLIRDEKLLVRAYQHIGVLDNRIENFGSQYRATEKAGEFWMIRHKKLVAALENHLRKLDQATRVAEAGHILVGEGVALRATHNDLKRVLEESAEQ